MNQHNGLPAIADQLAESRKKIIYLSTIGNVIVSLHVLALQTKKMLGLRRFKQAHSCMEIVNRLYESGSEPVRNAVENVYINSFPDMQLLCSRVEWGAVKAMMPGSLYKGYQSYLKYNS